MTDHEAHDESEVERELAEIPPDIWTELLRLVRLGVHTQSTCMESLGYTRNALSMKLRREPKFRKLFARAAAEGRIALTDKQLAIAEKAGQWQAFSRRAEIVHGEVHPLDAAKIDGLNRGADPETARAIAAGIASAFGTLPVNFEREPISEEPKGEPEGGEESEAS